MPLWRKIEDLNNCFYTLAKKMSWRERQQRYQHAFLPTRLPLEIDGRLLTAASTSTWVTVLSSAPTHEHTRTHKLYTWGGLPSHQSVRCSHNLIPIILSKECKQSCWGYISFWECPHFINLQETPLVHLLFLFKGRSSQVGIPDIDIWNF